MHTLRLKVEKTATNFEPKCRSCIDLLWIGNQLGVLLGRAKMRAAT